MGFFNGGLACFLLFLSGAYPVWQAWRGNRNTSLRHAVVWATVSWAAWAVLLLADALGGTAGLPAVRYLALSLTACAGVAVLGARRPGMAAWNFVLLGLLAVFLLPLAQGILTGNPPAGGELWNIFLAVTLLVSLTNYLFTRMAVAVVILTAACALEMAARRPGGGWEAPAAGWLLALAPWAGWTAMRWQQPVSEFDRCWLDFRNRFGLIWAQRLREQFNRAAANAGWQVELGWNGLRVNGPISTAETEWLMTLRALMKRFGVE